MTISAFDHPILGALLGDRDVAEFFTFDADLAAMLAFETALAAAQASLGLIPDDAARAIAEAGGRFTADLAGLAAGAARDGVVAPALVAQFRAVVGEPHGRHVHRGATSQDVIDTSLTMRLKGVCDLLDRRLGALVAILEGIEARDGAIPLMGRTRMQRALPITARDKLRVWRAPLARHRARLAELAASPAGCQFGGAVGTRHDLDGRGDAVAGGARAPAGAGRRAVLARQSRRDRRVRGLAEPRLRLARARLG